jgi:hypothetical protein
MNDLYLLAYSEISHRINSFESIIINKCLINTPMSQTKQTITF